MLLLVLSAPALALDVLVYGPNDYTEASVLTGLGHTVTEASATDWAAMTQSDFESYDVIYFGDKSCSGPDASDWDVIDANKTTWSPAITGNVVVTATDAACHYSNTYASLFIQHTAEWSGSTSGTGLVVSSDWGRDNLGVMTEFGSWTTSSNNGDSYVITDTSHAIWSYSGSTITDSGMDSWGNTYHSNIDAYPSDFDEIGTDSSGNTMTVVRDSDTDGDGYSSEDFGGDDCDDSDASIHPGATETCDSVDNDCDGDVDEDDASDAETWYADDDDDGYGDADETDTACDAPSGYVDDDTDCDDDDEDTFPGAAPNDSSTDCMTDADGDDYGDSSASGDVTAGTDCDDDDSSVNPGATEGVADGVDSDCDDIEHCYTDDDGDGYGSSDITESSDLDCTDSGEADDSDDCDDDDASVYDGAPEICDGLDNSCDGALANSENDDDGDGYVECTITGSGWDGDSSVVGGDDCDDTTASAYPGADEYCDGIDNDCEGDIDEDDALDVVTWYADADSDGYGDASVSDDQCEQPSAYVGDDTDCNDSDSGSYPGAPETPYDGIDQDCDGADWCDVDGDGYASDLCDGGDDCDDDDATIHPDAEDTWYDDIDSNCDGWSDYDADGDGYDSASYGGDDCDDADADVYPGAPDEPYDGVITDCDSADEYDQDGDGFDGGEDGSDCDDANSDIHPGADEEWYDGVDQDCDGNDDDQDEDGVGVDLDCDDLDPSVGEDCGGGDSGIVSDTGIPGGDKGCSCASATTPAAGFGFAALLGLVLLRRRR